MESICEKCENLMKIMIDHDTRTACLNAGFLSIGEVTKCSHFKPKAIKDNKAKEAIKILVDKGLHTTEGQTCDKCPNCNTYLSQHHDKLVCVDCLYEKPKAN